MEICFTYGGRMHCFYVPVLVAPLFPPKPPGGNYPNFLSDAFVVASLQSMTKHVADASVRQALESGITAAVGALQKHIGSDVTIRQVEAK
jgi:hypothetical protein